MSDVLLEVNDLETTFQTKKGNIKAVDQVSFKVNHKEILGIVGESGCGKSVTSLSIMRLISKRAGSVSGGRVILDGVNLLNLGEDDMRRVRGNQISLIFQNALSSLNPVLTIGTQLVETIRAHNKIPKKEARKRALEMLIKVGIPSPEQRLDEFPHQLSGGMCQRVVIAMALSCNASLLIADEPTTALDVTIQSQILDLLRDLKENSGKSIILITHDLGVVSEMADSIMVMYAGQVIEYASAQEIINNPRHPYTKGLLSSVPSLEGKNSVLSSIRGVVPDLHDLPKGCRFSPRCDEAFSKCFEQSPDLIRKEKSEVRCWLFENCEKGMGL